MFRNDLMELIQYAPQTADRSTRCRCCSARRGSTSTTSWTSRRGAASWSGPSSTATPPSPSATATPTHPCATSALDDYLLYGPAPGPRRHRRRSPASPKANMVGLCLGGTLTAMLLAHLAGSGDDRVNSATLLNTLVDFSEPGALGVFSDAESVARTRGQDGQAGLPRLQRDGPHLRPHAGQRPDLELRGLQLADGRGPARRSTSWPGTTTAPACRRPCTPSTCGPATSRTTWPGARWNWPARRLNLDDIKERRLHPGGQGRPHRPLDVGLQDHPAAEGDVRFVLSSSGHIAGIVNPPSSQVHALDQRRQDPADPKAWLAGRRRARKARGGRTGPRGSGAGRRPAPAPGDGEHRAPAAGRRPRDLRPRLT